MATQNLFELLGDEETDASAVIERAEAMEKVKKKQQQQEKTQLPQQQDPPKLPSKPVPPAQAVREIKAGQQQSGRGRGGQGNRNREYNNNYRNSDRDVHGAPIPPPQEGGFQRNRNFPRSEGYRQDGDGFQTNRGRFYGQGRPAQNFVEGGESGNNFEQSYRRDGDGFQTNRGRFYGQARPAQNFVEDGESSRGGGRFRGGARQGRPFGEKSGGFGEGQQQRAFVKKDVAGGLHEAQDKLEIGDAQEVEVVKESVVEKPPVEEPKTEVGGVDEKKEQEEENEMLLDDYYKVLDEKTKHLKSQRLDERKVVVDKDFEKMKKVERKQDEADFVKLGSEREKGKKKEAVGNTEEKVKKNLSINEFLRPAEGEQYYSGYRQGRGRSGRGRGRGSNERGEGFKGGFGATNYTSGRQDMAPRIEDPSQFPTLGGA